MKYILAHDFGTTGDKATLFDEYGALHYSATYSYTPDYLRDGWVEQQPEYWIEAFVATTKLFLEKVKAEDIAVISFSGQMNGCLCIDGQGKALHPHIIWADSRATEQNDKLRLDIGDQVYYKETGIRLTPTSSLQKLMWVRDNLPEVYEKTYKMLNAKDYVCYVLTGNIATDYSDASLTGAFNITKYAWSDDVLHAAGIGRDKLPDIIPSTQVVGHVTKDIAEFIGLKPGTPVVIGGGDGACAGVGAMSVSPGVSYVYMGSSGWMATASRKPVLDEGMRTLNMAHIVPNLVCPLAPMQAGGGSLTWLKETLCGEETLVAQDAGRSPYELIEELAMNSPAGANGVTFLPYLLGERSPRWNDYATAAFLGLRMETNKCDISRSVLEGVALNVRCVLEIFKKHVEIGSVVLIGGGARMNLWRSIIAQVLGVEIQKPENLEEATSLGAAFTGGVGIGLFSSFERIKTIVKIEDTIYPDNLNEGVYNKKFVLFNQLYEALYPLYSMMR